MLLFFLKCTIVNIGKKAIKDKEYHGKGNCTKYWLIGQHETLLAFDTKGSFVNDVTQIW